MSRQESITVFFPAYNDEHTIGDLVKQAAAVVEGLGFTDYEVLAINDGSEDGTAQVLAQVESELPQVRVITHPANRGYGGALRSGFSNATKDLIFYTDGDAQYDVDEIPLLLDELTDDVDIVNGYKVSRSDVWIRDIVGKLYRSTVRMLFRTPIRDIDCDFRLIRRQALEPVNLTMDSGAICLELVAELSATGARFAEVGVHHYPRQYGRSQFFRPRHIIQTLVDDLRFWFQLRQARRSYVTREEHDTR
jgi:glycosyltransferase involved in cell wall biosynthesis